MKWLLFRIFVTYYHWKVARKLKNYTVRDCWEYAADFGDYFDSAEWRSLISDAEYSVDEDFSYWRE